MKFNREYISIAVGYVLVILYIAFVNNPIINVILVVILFLFHIRIYTQIKDRLASEQKRSVSKLQSRLEKTKKQQEEMSDRFLSLSQSFGSGLLMVDADGIIQYSNFDMNEYFGRDFNQTDYQKLTEIKKLYQFINQAYLLEAPLRKQILHQGRSYDLISTPLFEDDLFKGALILAHDITTLRNAEEYQKRFTADVSHELRTPLSSIKGFSEILSRDQKMDETQRQEFIELIHSESERMEILLKDLTEISKLDRLDYELEKQPVDIKQLIEENVSILSNHIKEQHLTLKTDVISQNMRIDKHKMSQVLTNIIKNAINYTDEGSITIKGYPDTNRYKIEISDTGIGIKEKDYDKIFKRFYRVDKARSRDTGGSGLGLSISKNVVLKHGGSISVSSEVGKGSTFTIILPIEE